MSEAARELKIDPLSVDGFEEVFDAEAVPSRQPGDTVPQGRCEGSESVSQGLSFKEACSFYGLKATALRSRIKTGKIAAEKIDGLNGPEWRIYPEAVSQGSHNRNNTGAAAFRHPGDTVTDTVDNRLLDMIDDLQVKLEKANKDLQAATYRVGYLENQVIEREDDIQQLDVQMKLLTDSQHKTGWWDRFYSWFLGR
ncbi:MAG: hypothetical protein GC158_13655 [Cyanobacteria bacterium RI_101]|nr:hypothetical protein [Cyanobacteria bacterium RI_101]